MIRAYAVEPAVAATWGTPEHWAIFHERFMPHTKRLLVQYPGKQWGRLVRDCIPGELPYKLEVLLTEICKHAPKWPVDKLTPDEVNRWLEKAEQCLLQCSAPVHGLLAKENPRNNSFVIPCAPAFCADHEAWCNQEKILYRDPKAMADAVSPLLQLGKEIIFIEPHFSPDKDQFKNSYREFFKCIWEHRPSSVQVKVTIHTSGRRKGDKYKDISDIPQHILEQAKMHMPKIIPMSKNVTLCVWNNYPGKDKFHDRFLVIKEAGVSFSAGTDADTTVQTGQTLRITPLTSINLDNIWSCFVSRSSGHTTTPESCVFSGQ